MNKAPDIIDDEPLMDCLDSPELTLLFTEAEKEYDYLRSMARRSSNQIDLLLGGTPDINRMRAGCRLFVCKQSQDFLCNRFPADKNYLETLFNRAQRIINLNDYHNGYLMLMDFIPTISAFICFLIDVYRKSKKML